VSYDQPVVSVDNIKLAVATKEQMRGECSCTICKPYCLEFTFILYFHHVLGTGASPGAVPRWC